MADVLGRILIKAPQRMNHGSVAGVLSFGGKIPANSNSVFASRQSPFSAPAIAGSAFCKSCCSVAEGREEGGSGDGSGCGSGSVATTQDSFAGKGVRATRASLAGEGLAGEGARPTFPTLASLKSEGDQASSPMMRSGTRNRSTVTSL